MLFVFIGASSYGFLPPFAKLAFADGFSIGQVNGSQNLFAALLMWILATIMGGREKVSVKQFAQLLLVGATIGVTGYLYYRSLAYLSVSLSTVVQFQFIWIGILIEAVLNRQRPSNAKLLAIVLLLIGTVFAAGVLDTDVSQYSLFGILLAFLSAITYAMYFFFSGKIATELKIWKRSAIIVTGSGLFISIMYPPVYLVDGTLLDGLLFWALILAVFGSALPAVCLNLGIPRVGVGLSSIIGAAELPSAVFFSSVIVHESVTALQWLGICIIMFGIAVPELFSRTKKMVQHESQAKA